MATKGWNQFYVLCPFFLQDDGKFEIRCEGIHDGCDVCLKFRTKQEFKIQLDTYCKNHYKKCEIYRTVMEKYEE